MGTAALGSLVITICRILRMLLREKKDNTEDHSPGAVITRCIMQCCKWLIENFLKLIEYISDRALVICSLHGTAFWASVKRVSKLFSKDIPLVFAVEYVSNIVLGVCYLVVAAVVSAIAFVIVSEMSIARDPLSVLLVLLTVFIISCDLSRVLFTSYDIAIDTILACTSKCKDNLQNRSTIKRLICSFILFILVEDWFGAKIQLAQHRYFESDVLNNLLKEPGAA